MAVKTQLGRFQRNGIELNLAVLRAAINEDAVPVNLQVRGDANPPSPWRQLAREIGRNGARSACGETHVIDDAHPSAIRENLHVRRDRFDLGLVGGVHAGGGEVFRLAMHQENERAATIGLAEI